jgi:NAD(P)-dependent dehydrogenase (short-subunit alcohol dehydrogenase family)
MCRQGSSWEGWIDTLTVGLRSSDVATEFAAPPMLLHHHGLVVFTSSSGAVRYAFRPAYGVPKAVTALSCESD